MKRSFWLGIALLLLGPAQAQSLTGVWQGVETEAGQRNAYWPAVLRLQKIRGAGLFGVLYQEVGDSPDVSVTFRMSGARTATGLRLEHGPKLSESGSTPFAYWCDGAIAFIYDPAQEKLTGRAAYRPVADCDQGTFTLYRIRLKSAATIPAGATTLRVSGRNVQWFANADRKQLVNTGNAYLTRLAKTTTFYLTQGFYPTSQSPVVPITIQVTGAAPKVVTKPTPLPAPPGRRDTTGRAPAPVVSATPVVLPTVLFRLGTAELLPEARPALDRLTTELKTRPLVRVRILGYTDRIGEPGKNQVLSEQRAAAVKAVLVQAGVEAGRIETVGYGDARPLYPSPDARNRRVEVEEAK